MKKLLFITISLCVASAAWAKLPPLSDEAQAKAAETKAKAAWADKVAAYKLCLSQDKVAARYLKTKAAVSNPAVVIPACQDPGPYVMVEAATAANTNTTANATIGTAKPPAPAAEPAKK